MSFNTFGHMFRVTTFGESHGVAIGCVVDGCPPGIALSAADIQRDLDRRRPGQSKFVTQRREPDEVRILSGTFTDPASGAEMTLGTPIALVIDNVDARSKDYDAIAETYRPGHADYTYDVKYGLRDPRGSGRASARETAARVAAGAVARKIVPSMKVRGANGRNRDRPQCMGLGRDFAQSVLLPGCEGRKKNGKLSRRHPQERLLDRRRDRGDRRGRAAGTWESRLWQARRGARGRADGDQCG
jgi:hypothetical protein